MATASRSTKEPELGDQVRDLVTGFTGIVVCLTHWLNGCVRAGVQAQRLKEDKPIDAQHFDIETLVVIKSAVVSPRVQLQPTGGPRPAPTRAVDPQR